MYQDGLDRGGSVMVLNATLNNISTISRRSVLLVEETGVRKKTSTYRSHSQTLSHNVTSSTPHHELHEQLIWKITMCRDGLGRSTCITT